MVEGDHVGPTVAEPSGDGGSQGSAVAEVPKGDAPLVEFGPAPTQLVELTHLGHGRRAGGSTGQVPQGTERVGSGDAVQYQPGVPLEVAQGTGGVGSEDAVDPTGVEAEAPETELEVGDVVATEHRRVQVQVAVAEAVAGLDEGGQRVVIDVAVLVQAPLRLEPGDLGSRVWSESAVGQLVVDDRMAGVFEAPVQVPDAGAGGADGERLPGGRGVRVGHRPGRTGGQCGSA